MMKYRKRRTYILFFVFLLISVPLLADGEGASSPGVSPSNNMVAGFTVKDLRQSMVTENTDLRKMWEDVAQSLLDVKDAKAGYSPTIDLQVSGTYMFNPPVGPITLSTDEILNGLGLSSIPGVDPNGYVTIYDGMENTLYQFSLSLTQPVFTWGKIPKSVKLYQLVAEVRQLQLASKQSELEAELETRVASLWYLDRIMTLLVEQQGYAARLVELARQGEANGMILHQDVLEAEIQAKQLDITVQETNEKFESVLLGLRTLTGIPDLLWPMIDFKSDESAYLALLDRKYDLLEVQATSSMQNSLKMLDKLQSVASYAQDIAEASVYWKPDLALVVDLGYGGSRFPLVEKDWYRQDMYTANLTVAIKTTVWDGGKKLNDIKRAKSSAESSSVDKDAALATIRRTLREQWLAMDLAKSKIEYQQLKISVARSKIDQQRTLFDSGYGDESALLQAQIEECTARIELEQQKLALANAYYTIRYLTG